MSYFILFYISVPSLVSKQWQEGKYGAEHAFTFNNIVKSCLQTQNYTHIMGEDRQCFCNNIHFGGSLSYLSYELKPHESGLLS